MSFILTTPGKRYIVILDLSAQAKEKKMGSAKCSYCGLMMETSEGASFGPHEEGCPYGKDPEILRVFSDGQEDGANGREKEPNRGATYNLGFQKGLEVLESVREAQSFDLKSVESAPH